MKRIIKNYPILFFSFYFLLIYLISKFLVEGQFANFGVRAIYVDLLEKGTLNFIVVLFTFQLIKFLGLGSLAGTSSLKIKYWYFLLVPILYIYLLSFNADRLNIALGYQDRVLLYALIFKALSLGFFEEFVFRGLLQSLIISKYFERYGLILCVCAGSVVFGGLHIVNLFKEEYSLIGVTSQVVMASCIGFFLGAFHLKTNNIYPFVLVHAINNFFASVPKVFPENFPEYNSVVNSSPLEIVGSVVITFFIFGIPTIIPSIFVLKSISNEEIRERLNNG